MPLAMQRFFYKLIDDKTITDRVAFSVTVDENNKDPKKFDLILYSSLVALSMISNNIKIKLDLKDKPNIHGNALYFEDPRYFILTSSIIKALCVKLKFQYDFLSKQLLEYGTTDKTVYQLGVVRKCEIDLSIRPKTIFLEYQNRFFQRLNQSSISLIKKYKSNMYNQLQSSQIKTIEQVEEYIHNNPGTRAENLYYTM